MSADDAATRRWLLAFAGATAGGRSDGGSDLRTRDRAEVRIRTNLYETTFGGPCGGSGKVGELAAGTAVQVTAACEDANGDGWVEVAPASADPVGWVDPADLTTTGA